MILFKRNDSNIFFFLGVFLSVSVLLLLMSDFVFSQQPDTSIEKRVQQLEQEVAAVQPMIIELSDNLNKSIREYTKGLESSLEDYSRKLERGIEARLDNFDSKAVVLNPYSRAYQSIETNTGTFLLAVDKVEPIENGVRLHVNIGNPNFADYQNFKLKFIWGKKWLGGHVTPYNEWRQSLKGAEYTFQGKIEKGKWNVMAVDLTPTDGGQLGYLECEMSVTSVELGLN